MMEMIRGKRRPRRSAVPPDRRGRRTNFARVAVVVVVVLLGLLVTLATYRNHARREQRLVEARFRLEAETRSRIIEREFVNDLRVLHSLSAYYANSFSVLRAEFRTFVQPLLKRHPNVLSVQWAPRVTPEEREDHVRSVRESGVEGYRVLEKQADGRLVPASADQTHFPILYAEPFEQNVSVLGYDLNSEPTRREALERARDTGRFAATARVQPPRNGGEDRHVVLVYGPIYQTDDLPPTQEERREKLEGFVLTAIDVGRTVRSALGYLNPVGIDVRLFDYSAPPGEQLLYATDADSPAVLSEDDSDRPPLRHALEIEVAGRKWAVVCLPTRGYLGSLTTAEPSTILIGGLLMTGLLGGYLVLLTGRTTRVEHLVERRTAERDRFFTISLDLLCVAGFDGYIKRLNPAWTRTLGYPAEELLSRPYIDFIHPADRERTMETVAASADGSPVEGFECRFRCSDGTYRYLAWNAVPLPEEGLIYAVARDMTDRIEADRALVRSEKQLKSVTDNSPALIYVKDRQGRYLLVNQRYEELFGVSREEVRGRVDREVIDEETALAMRENDLRVLEEDRPIEFEEVIAWNGSERTYLSTKFPLADGDGHSYAVCTLSTDITERKRAQEALALRTDELARSNADLEEFAYAASHDLRAPLRSISNLSEWIEEDAGACLTGEIRHNMDLLRNRVHRMETLIEDLLTYSRAGRSREEIEPVDVSELLADVVFLLDPPEAFTVRVEPGMPVFRTARGPLERVFYNLIGNAIRHHDRSDGRVHVHARRLGAFHEFTISDDGPGIAPEFHERIFKMFHTLRPRDQVEGSGLGLALVKKLVRRYGGGVWLAKNTGVGTAFHFTWPQKLNQEKDT